MPVRPDPNSKHSRIKKLLQEASAKNEKPDFEAIAEEISVSIAYVSYTHWRMNNLERSRENIRKWRKRNPEKYAAMRKRNYDRNYDKSRAHQHWRRYTDLELEMILDQGLSDEALSKELGRTIHAIQNKRHSLLLKQKKGGK